MKQLWLLAGGNGAGKTTFYDMHLGPHGLPFINADNIARYLYPDDPEGNSYLTAQMATHQREKLLQEGASFCFETVFSHPSKVDFLASARALGYEVILVFIHVESTQLNLARISQRVRKGGHNVPEEKVKKRLPRSLHHLKLSIPLCDEVRVLDNSSSVRPYHSVLTFKAGRLIMRVGDLPAWARALLADR